MRLLTIVLSLLGIVPILPGAEAEFSKVDSIINQAIVDGQCPGAVLVVGRKAGVVYQKAYGQRAIEPAREAMTLDTIFDLASLTKPVATATSVMILADRGKIDLQEKATKYLPDFAPNGKDRITVEQLLLHFSGLTPDNALADYADGPERAWQRVCQLKLVSEPGKKFAYSDVGFIVLGKLVEKVDGRTLDRFAAEELFGPLGMKDTRFLPPAAWSARIAPTQKRKEQWMRGQVHDPRAFALGGVAGHAGLFSTGGDLSRYCRMMLHGGETPADLRPASPVAGAPAPRIFSRATFERMTTGHSPPGSDVVRTPGFDMKTGYSQPLGERFTAMKSFGHTGFTGTSIWISPADDAFVILLTNAVHPAGKGKVLALRRAVSTAVAEALGK